MHVLPFSFGVVCCPWWALAPSFLLLIDVFACAHLRRLCVRQRIRRATVAISETVANRSANAMTLAGLEPAIFGPEDQRLIH